MDDKDVEKLFGGDFEADHFNDGALGRPLDKLYEAGPEIFLKVVDERILNNRSGKVNSLFVGFLSTNERKAFVLDF